MRYKTECLRFSMGLLDSPPAFSCRTGAKFLLRHSAVVVASINKRVGLFAVKRELSYTLVLFEPLSMPSFDVNLSWQGAS